MVVLTFVLGSLFAGVLSQGDQKFATHDHVHSIKEFEKKILNKSPYNINDLRDKPIRETHVLDNLNPEDLTRKDLRSRLSNLEFSELQNRMQDIFPALPQELRTALYGGGMGDNFRRRGNGMRRRERRNRRRRGRGRGRRNRGQRRFEGNSRRDLRSRRLKRAVEGQKEAFNEQGVFIGEPQIPFDVIDYTLDFMSMDEVGNNNSDIATLNEAEGNVLNNFTQDINSLSSSVDSEMIDQANQSSVSAIQVNDGRKEKGVLERGKSGKNKEEKARGKKVTKASVQQEQLNDISFITDNEETIKRGKRTNRGRQRGRGRNQPSLRNSQIFNDRGRMSIMDIDRSTGQEISRQTGNGNEGRFGRRGQGSRNRSKGVRRGMGRRGRRRGNESSPDTNTNPTPMSLEDFIRENRQDRAFVNTGASDSSSPGTRRTRRAVMGATGIPRMLGSFSVPRGDMFRWSRELGSGNAVTEWAFAVDGKNVVVVMSFDPDLKNYGFVNSATLYDFTGKQGIVALRPRLANSPCFLFETSQTMDEIKAELRDRNSTSISTSTVITLDGSGNPVSEEERQALLEQMPSLRRQCRGRDIVKATPFGIAPTAHTGAMEDLKVLSLDNEVTVTVKSGSFGVNDQTMPFPAWFQRFSGLPQRGGERLVQWIGQGRWGRGQGRGRWNRGRGSNRRGRNQNQDQIGTM